MPKRSISQRIKSLSLGTLEDFEAKRIEVEQRLAGTFIAFINNANAENSYFITGGKIPPSIFGNNNFRLVVVGSSLAELAYAEDLFREISSSMAANFSSRGKDLHSTTVLEYFSRCLKDDLEDMRAPIGHALEFAIIDRRGYLMRINFDGEMEIDDLSETEERVFISGAYPEKSRNILLAELKKAPKQIKESEMIKFAEGLKKKYKLSQVGYVV